MKTIHKISLLAAAAVMAIALSSFIHIGDPMKMYERAKQEQMRNLSVCENCESPGGHCVCEGDLVYAWTGLLECTGFPGTFFKMCSLVGSGNRCGTWLDTTCDCGENC